MDKGNLQCWKCKIEPDVASYLNGVKVWWPLIETLQHICNICGYREEIQLKKDKIILGYIYGAGTAHFAAMLEIEVIGLEVIPNKDFLLVKLSNLTWQIPAKS